MHSLSTSANNLEDLVYNRLVAGSYEQSLLRAKLLAIFRYHGLPLTVPKNVLESMLTTSGKVTVYELDGDLFVTRDVPTSGRDVYGRPTVLHTTHTTDTESVAITRTVDKDCVVIENLPGGVSFEQLIYQWSMFEAQAKVSSMNLMVSLRSPAILQAKDDDTFDQAMEFERARRDGSTSVILAEQLDDLAGLVVHPTPTAGNPATQLVELVAATRASFWDQLGINTASNLKRAYVSDSELSMGQGAPLLDTMLDCRQEAVEKVNALFGTDISVEVSSSWSGAATPEDINNEEMDDDEDFDRPADSAPSDDRADGDVDVDGPAVEDEEESMESGEPEAESMDEPLTEAEVTDAADALGGEEDDGEDSRTGDSGDESDDSEDD